MTVQSSCKPARLLFFYFAVCIGDLLVGFVHISFGCMIQNGNSWNWQAIRNLLQMMLRESIMKIRMKKGMLTYQHGSLKLILSIVFLHAQLQQQLHIVLQTSFGEHEKEIFSNFAIIHDMTAAADQQPRPMHGEVEKGILHLTIAGSINGTYEFLASSARDESGHCFKQKTIQGWR